MPPPEWRPYWLLRLGVSMEAQGYRTIPVWLSDWFLKFAEVEAEVREQQRGPDG